MLVGVGLNKPRLDHDNGHHTQNNDIYLSVYVCIIYLVFVAPWFLRSVYVVKCSVYFGILTCPHAWFITACTQLNSRTTGSTHVCCAFYQ